MSGLAGLAAGLAEGFAGGRRLKSELETEKTRRDAMGLQMENQRLQNESLVEQRESQKALGKLETNWASGEGYRPPEAPEGYDHRTDPTAVAKYYEDLRGAMRRQAAAYGRPTTDADRAVDTLMKEKYQEKLGRAISLMKSNPAAAIPAIRSVYSGFRDGNDMTGGTYDKATDSFIFKGKDKDGNEVDLPPMSRADAIEGLAYSLTGADAGKLYLKSLETDKVLAAEARNLGVRIKSQEQIAREQNQSQERIGDARNKTTLQATGIEAGSRVRAAEIGAGSREDAQAESQLRFDLNTVGSVFSPQLQSIKDDPRSSFKPEDRKKQIDALTSQMGWTEEVIRLNHRIGNRDGISARAIANMAEDGMTAKIAPRITGPYLDPRTNKPNLDYAVVDNKFVIPTPKGVSFKQQQ